MATRAEQRKATAQRDADTWNREHAVGTRVRYWRMVRKGPPSGEAPTSAPAEVVGDDAVVRVEGVSGCVALSHVEVVS